MGGSTPRVVPDDAGRRLLEVAEIYAGDGLFAPPTEAGAVTRTIASAPDPSAPLVVTDIRFDSTYRPFLSTYRDEHERHRENLVVHARHLSGGPRRPAVILLHGWSQGPYWMTSRMFSADGWLRRGYDVVLFQLPFHGARAPITEHALRSGALFPGPHVVRTNETFGQAIHDLRQLAAHLRSRGATAVGVMGLSLGAYTTALWASLDEELAFAIAMAPPVSLADLMWRHGQSGDAWRRATAAGVTHELLDDAFRVHAPTTRPPQLARERLMIVAGHGDRITPPDQAETLWKHWGECAIHWYAGGHLAQLGRSDAMRAVWLHLETLGLVAPPAPRASKSQRGVPR